MKKELIERISNIKNQYGKSKTDIINKALEMGLNEIELYYQIEKKFFTDQKKSVDKKYSKLNVGEDAKPQNLTSSPVALQHEC